MKKRFYYWKRKYNTEIENSWESYKRVCLSDSDSASCYINRVGDNDGYLIDKESMNVKGKDLNKIFKEFVLSEFNEWNYMERENNLTPVVLSWYTQNEDKLEALHEEYIEDLEKNYSIEKLDEIDITKRFWLFIEEEFGKMLHKPRIQSMKNANMRYSGQGIDTECQHYLGFYNTSQAQFGEKKTPVYSQSEEEEIDKVVYKRHIKGKDLKDFFKEELDHFKKILGREDDECSHEFEKSGCSPISGEVWYNCKNCGIDKEKA